MDNFQKLKRQVALRISLALLAIGIVGTGSFWASYVFLELDNLISIGVSVGVVGITTLIFAQVVTQMALKPLYFIWQAILHVDPDHQGTSAPNIDKLRLGRELVSGLTMQVYQFASQQNSKALIEHRKEIIQASNIVSHLPLPLFVFNKDLLVTNASDASMEYCQIESSKLFGKPIFESLNLEFPSELTLETWIKECQTNHVTNNGYWERVRVRSPDGTSLRQCDLAAYYNRDNPSGAEFIVTLYDRTKQYDHDDKSMSFVALAVHELRTPLTILRGYIEVFQEELGDQLNDELKSFMLKMDASANQLTSFVHNILNVARIDDDQLSLHLTEEPWEDVLRKGAADMELRAKVHDKTIEFVIAPGLPTAAVDRVSVYEVINNLLDNAIKYSPITTRIVVTSKLNKEGLIETTIQDFGVGIPTSVLPNLFEKFYRNHRTRGQIGGTGLGLYLSKAIVTAHSGQIWAQSKEGEGSTFGFTLVPYAKLAAELKTGDNTDIVRQTHGWIKNHSLYKR